VVEDEVESERRVRRAVRWCFILISKVTGSVGDKTRGSRFPHLVASRALEGLAFDCSDSGPAARAENESGKSSNALSTISKMFRGH
jgi:hypothetical protein